MDEKIPISQVLDDMYGDKGPASWAARDYYKIHYATPSERKRLEREEKIEFVFAVCVWIVIIAGLAFTVISGVA